MTMELKRNRRRVDFLIKDLFEKNDEPNFDPFLINQIAKGECSYLSPKFPQNYSKVRLYRNLAEAVIHVLELIFDENRYADKVIEKIFKANPKWGARDRRFIAETTYDIVRWHRFLKEVSGAPDKDYWRLLGTWLIWKQIDIPTWEEFKPLDSKLIQSNLTKEYPLAIKQSIPDWLDHIGKEQLGGKWENEITHLNHEAAVVLRVNTLKGEKTDIQKILESENISTEINDNYRDALILKKRMNVFNSQAFKNGLFEVQDTGSQLIAPFLRVEPGMRVIDACAGAGGKTLHIASLLQNKGRIIAMDTEDWKLNELKKRARRAGVSNIECRVIESSKTIKRLAESADRLLLDVPCSGLGVLKRNPDAKWKLSIDYLDKVKEVQQKILSEYSVMTKSGGMMVYATCSILPSENEMQVERFLQDHAAEFELVEQHHAWPSDGFDGFYMALIKKK